MNFQIFARIVALSVGALVTVACQYSPDMTERAMAYNEAVADSNNQILLLNIIRSSRRFPRYYSRLESDAATASLTPSLSLTLPVGKGMTHETDWDANGKISGAKAISAWSTVASLLGTQGTESNLMTLQSLDDQNYQYGMQTPVSIGVVKTYWDEGYQPDLLMLLYVSQATVRDGLLKTIDDDVKALCADATVSSASDRATPFCNIRNAPEGIWLPAKSVSKDVSLLNCVANGGALKKVIPKPGSKTGETEIYDTFINDPAREATLSRARAYHPQLCFQILIEDLIALGLVPKTGGPSYDIIDHGPGLSDKWRDSPKFRADALQSKIKFVPKNGAGEGPDLLCTQKSGDDSFGISIKSTETAKNIEDNASQSDSTSGLGKFDYEKAVDRCSRFLTKDEGSGDTPKSDLVTLGKKDFALTPRSFESMIYYLGELVRYEEFVNDRKKTDADLAFEQLAPPVTVIGRSPESFDYAYGETLFYAAKEGMAAGDTALSVNFDHDTFAIPTLCPSKELTAQLSIAAAKSCSTEYPSHESTVVMQLLNQIWGLQKTMTTVPSSPTISITAQ